MASKPANPPPTQQANGFTNRRDRPWLLPCNRKLRNLHSISLRNICLDPPKHTRQRTKTIDDDAIPDNLVSPAKRLALREQKALGHSRSSSDLRRVPEDAISTDAKSSDGDAHTNGSPKKNERGTPTTPKRPPIARLRRRSTLEWVNASPQRRQEKLESVIEERLADVFFSLHVHGIHEPVYVSETVERTMNPTFRSIDLSTSGPGNTRLDGVTVRFWVKTVKWDAWRQLLELSINLRELQYLGKHLEDLQRPLPQNAVIFHLPDGVYTSFISLADYTPPPVVPLARANSSRALNTSSFDALLRLSKLDDSIQDALATRNKLAADLEALFDANKDSLIDRDRVAEAHDRLKTIEYAKKTVFKQLDKARKQQEEKRASLASRRNLMTQDKKHRAEQAATMRDGRPNIPRIRTQREEHRKAVHAQRRRICEDLQTLYPIHPIPNKALAFTIRSLHLPNTESTDSEPPDKLAAALGHVAHLLQLLSFYLAQPLPYPLNPRSSTSTIHDPISLLKTNSTSSTNTEKAELALRTYPLFPRGVPRFRFEYALFLLNKDIQLLLESAFGVKALDIRQTLPNLKYLLYVATAGEGELPARKAGGVRGLMRGGSRSASNDSASSALSGLLWHGGGKENGSGKGSGKGAVESLRRLGGK